eukprot:1157298-Pelagomonas_calceolata.AAC.22
MADVPVKVIQPTALSPAPRSLAPAGVLQVERVHVLEQSNFCLTSCHPRPRPPPYKSCSSIWPGGHLRPVGAHTPCWRGCWVTHTHHLGQPC